jgi:dephospho-CoA kinase
MVIGLLGGIGSGKSAVARLFAEAGAEAVDADQIAGEVLATDAVKARVSGRFGPQVLDPRGEVDRRKLADLVFTDRARLAELNAIVHPPVLERIRARIRSHRHHRGAADLLVLDVPLLLESSLTEECDAMVYVDAGPEVRRSRTAARGWPPGEIERREAFQAPLEAKRAAARWIVDNSGPLEATRQAVDRLIREIASPGARLAEPRPDGPARRRS